MAAEVYLFPASFEQQRLWFLDQLVPGNPFYNISAAIRLSFQLDAALFARSLNEVVRRHEILRTTFQVVDGEPFQAVAPELRIEVPLDNLEALPSGDRDARIHEI